ncbi:MAG: hypothetical protein ACRENE_23250 [Polyangiaceae bacterium]
MSSRSGYARLRLGLRVLAAVVAAVLAHAPDAQAQRRRPPPPQQQQPQGDGKPSDEDEDHGSMLRSEPTIEPPADPLAMPPAARDAIGSDWDGIPPSPEGSLHATKWFPYYEERRGDYRLRLLPPLVLEHTRGLPDPSQTRYGVPQTPDTEGLYGLLYYRRRSLQLDMDVLFPAVWRVRDGESHTIVVGPVAHREAPFEHDNCLAPLFFEGSRKDGGYFHAPLLLTTSHWSSEGAFALAGPYFRLRTGTDVSMGIAPLLFHGDNGNIDGNRRRYTFIPPLLYYHSDQELEGTATTIVGPVVAQSSRKRDVLDVAPLFFHIKGKPGDGGVDEEHTTLFPLFHYGHSPEENLFIVPGYMRRITPTADTLLTPFFSRAITHRGATSLTAAGPVLPLWWNYTDTDLGVHAWALAPFFYQSDSPAGHDWLTPLVGRFETYGEHRTWWAFPTLTVSTDRHGWEGDLHPLVYVGRSDDSSHTVVAPIFWDFASPKGRTTVGFPLYWRFAEGPADSVIQVAANTLYTEKRVAGGKDWEFHLLPLFSYGEHPGGYFWNVLFGLAGYSRNGPSSQVRVLWAPINFGPDAPQQTATAPLRPAAR